MKSCDTCIRFIKVHPFFGAVGRCSYNGVRLNSVIKECSNYKSMKHKRHNVDKLDNGKKQSYLIEGVYSLMYGKMNEKVYLNKVDRVCLESDLREVEGQRDSAYAKLSDTAKICMVFCKELPIHLQKPFRSVIEESTGLSWEELKRKVEG